MKNIGTLFLATAIVFGIAGMVWGIQMSAGHDYALAPAHAHLNLIGWVGMAIFGIYYSVTPHAAGKLASAHYGLSVLTIIILVPGIVNALRETGETLAKIGSILAVITMLVFLYVVIRNGVGRRT